jgi:hypothetical protein
VFPTPGLSFLQRSTGAVLNQPPTSPERIVSTVPANGDVNPYGVAFVPEGFREGGPLAGDILVSNFNNNENHQGTVDDRADLSYRPVVGFLSRTIRLRLDHGAGSAAARIRSGGEPSHHRRNFGDNPGAPLVAGAGRFGNQVANLTDAALLAGPWDLAINDRGFIAQVFVSNVLSGTVTRLDVVVGGGLKIVGRRRLRLATCIAPIQLLW